MLDSVFDKNTLQDLIFNNLENLDSKYLDTIWGASDVQRNLFESKFKITFEKNLWLFSDFIDSSLFISRYYNDKNISNFLDLFNLKKKCIPNLLLGDIHGKNLYKYFQNPPTFNLFLLKLNHIKFHFVDNLILFILNSKNIKFSSFSKKIIHSKNENSFFKELSYDELLIFNNALFYCFRDMNSNKLFDNFMNYESISLSIFDKYFDFVGSKFILNEIISPYEYNLSYDEYTDLSLKIKSYYSFAI